jgi:hypothetical protein
MTVRVEWHGDSIMRRLDKATVRGLWLAAVHLLGESQAVVPIEEATLERSGVASVDASQMKAAVSYDTVYAVRQHEELDWQHDSGRQAKYLEAPMHVQQAIMLAIIAAAIRREMRG